MTKYYPPTFKAKQFHCIHCGVYAKQEWSVLCFGYHNANVSPISYCVCGHCEKVSFWYAEKQGLPVQVQQAFDYCRVVGNNAVHPGEINLNDSPDMGQHLFNMINFIIEDRITRPRHVAALYEKLPEAARDAIEKRDR